jgi:hypothetical protein
VASELLGPTVTVTGKVTSTRKQAKAERLELEAINEHGYQQTANSTHQPTRN